METRPYVAWDVIGPFMVDVFKAYGVPEEDAKIMAEHRERKKPVAVNA